MNEAYNHQCKVNSVGLITKLIIQKEETRRWRLYASSIDTFKPEEEGKSSKALVKKLLKRHSNKSFFYLEI